MRIRTVVVDDEKNSRDVMELLLKQHCPEVEIKGKAASVDEALRVITETDPELVFLDIEMPGKNGFDLLNKLDRIDFRVVFTTLHPHYALKAIKASALDYLLKPVNVSELKEAVKKTIEWLQREKSDKINTIPYPANNLNVQKKIALPAMDELLLVTTDDILYCESDNNYTYFHFKDQRKVLVSRTLKDCEELLVPYNFFRIHQSYLINMKYVRKYIKGQGGHVVMEDGSQLDVSTRKKDEFMAQLNKF